MAKSKKTKSSSGTNKFQSSSTAPLIFISHDSRDAELAEAFSNLLKSVSSGMLKSFRSSEKGTEGIEFGDEWYKRIMSKVESASDVICLFTEQSINRPWILYEAGVAKGKLNTKVYGIALGISLEKVSIGPFYQFENCDDSEKDLTDLINQLAKKRPDLEPYPDVVKTQVQAFRGKATKILAKSPKSKKKEKPSNGTSVAKLLEEMKVMFRDLPSRVENRLAETIDPIRRRRIGRVHPMMLAEIMDMFDIGNPIGILMIASMVRDDIPFLYEVLVEIYRAVKSDDSRAIEQALMGLEFVTHGPFREEFGVHNKDTHIIMREVEHIIQRYLGQTKNPTIRRKK